MRTAARRPTDPGPRPTRAVALLALPLSLTLLAGCKLPDVSMSSQLVADGSEATATSSSAARSTPTPSVAEAAAPSTTPRPSGPLDAGTMTSVLPAGDRQLVIDYWTSEDATEWGPDDTKTIQLSAHLEVDGADAPTTVEVLVTRFTAVADDGTSRVTVTDDRGEFALQPPFTYGTALEIPPSTADAASLSLTIQFDLLVETGRDTDRYFRQTVIDTLELPLVSSDLEEDTQ